MKANKNKTLRFSFLTNKALFIFIASVFAGCNDFVRIDPPKTEIISQTVFSSDASATSAMRGIYSLMTADASFTNGQIEMYSGLSADELDDYSGNDQQVQFYNNSLVSTNPVLLNPFWGEGYKYIGNANAMIEGLQGATQLSSAVKNQLTGEALFVRAFCHFYLVNLFGDIPYINTTDYRVTSASSRMPVPQVYENIISDLTTAETLLSADFSFSYGERSQPTKWAANSLLARVYLYNKDWANAISHSATVINSTDNFSLLADPTQVFLANSNEAIWQLQPVTPEHSTGQAKYFILKFSPNNVALTQSLISAFDAQDNRMTSWIGSFNDGASTYYFADKYKVYSAPTLTEYSMVLRLAEQYLIRAEAEAQQNLLADAIADTDIIRARAGLPLIASTNPSISQSDLLIAIEKERRNELFTEYGHRWFDLKRTGRAEAVLGLVKQDWQPSDQLFPIPQSEIKLDPALKQNPGY